jgi:hypothetical protein
LDRSTQIAGPALSAISFARPRFRVSRAPSAPWFTSGVSILQALDITRDTAGNTVIANAISQVHDRVKEGESIVQAARNQRRLFRRWCVSMIDVGGRNLVSCPTMLVEDCGCL